MHRPRNAGNRDNHGGPAHHLGGLSCRSLSRREHNGSSSPVATGRVGRHVVEVLRAGGQEVVPISRATGVDVITGQGLPAALCDASCIIDVATGPSAEQGPSHRILYDRGGKPACSAAEAGVGRMVVVSIIGCDQFETGYSAAKAEHERAALAGPIPVQIVRAAQFHEFVPVLMAWGDRGEVCYVPKMRTQLVSAKTVAESLVYYATATTWPAEPPSTPYPEIAGPREESLVEAATLLAARRGQEVRIEGVNNPDERAAPGRNRRPVAGTARTLAGPTFAEWLDNRGRELAGPFCRLTDLRSRTPDQRLADNGDSSRLAWRSQSGIPP